MRLSYSVTKSSKFSALPLQAALSTAVRLKAGWWMKQIEPVISLEETPVTIFLPLDSAKNSLSSYDQQILEIGKYLVLS